jgi:hypothetical protein
VRPHPSRKREWDEVDWRSVPDLALWGDNPIDTESRADYFDSLHYSAAVVGLNTSAFIEAGIVGSPVLAVLPEEFRPNQEGTLHFRYLVDGGLLTISRSLADHCGQLASILGGDTQEILRRQREFVRTFVRPLGLDMSATCVLADAVEALGTVRPQHAVSAPAAVARFGLITLRALARIHAVASCCSTSARSKENSGAPTARDAKSAGCEDPVFRSPLRVHADCSSRPSKSSRVAAIS